jgi:hypothetical protein
VVICVTFPRIRTRERPSASARDPQAVVDHVRLDRIVLWHQDAFRSHVCWPWSRVVVFGLPAANQPHGQTTSDANEMDWTRLRNSSQGVRFWRLPAAAIVLRCPGVN